MEIEASRIHVVFAVASGGWLGVGNDSVYVKTRSFETFPFPDCDETSKARIGSLADSLDAHRRRQHSLHPKITITEMYNVLAKLRCGEPLSEKDKAIHEQGLVSVLKQIHDDLDAAVFDAYGWPQDLPDDELLQRLVDLNHERAEEEKRGLIRWLRPEYQNPEGTQAATATQKDLPIEPKALESPDIKAEKRPWPKTLPEQAQVVRAVLAEHPSGLTAEQLARVFARAKVKLVTDLLETLVSLGQARALETGRYVRS